MNTNYKISIVICFRIDLIHILHTMRFTAFQEIQLNLGLRDIEVCRWTKPTHRATITHTQGIYLGVGAMEHTPSTHASRTP